MSTINASTQASPVATVPSGTAGMAGTGYTADAPLALPPGDGAVLGFYLAELVMKSAQRTENATSEMRLKEQQHAMQNALDAQAKERSAARDKCIAGIISGVAGMAGGMLQVAGGGIGLKFASTASRSQSTANKLGERLNFPGEEGLTSTLPGRSPSFLQAEAKRASDRATAYGQNMSAVAGSSTGLLQGIGSVAGSPLNLSAANDEADATFSGALRSKAENDASVAAAAFNKSDEMSKQALQAAQQMMQSTVDAQRQILRS